MESPSTVSVPREAANAFVFSLDLADQRDFVLEHVALAQAEMRTFAPIWREVQDNYLVSPLSDPVALGIGWSRGPFAQLPQLMRNHSVLKDPETHQVVETLVSQAMALLMPSRDYIVATPFGRAKDDYERARLLSRLLMAIFETPGWHETQYQIIKDAFLFGTAIVELTWETRGQYQMTPTPQFDQRTGAYVGDSLAPQWVIYKDQPLFKQIPLWDFFPDFSGTRLHRDMQGAAKRGELTKAMVKEMIDGEVYMRNAAERVLTRITSGRDSRGMDEKQHPDLMRSLPDKTGRIPYIEYVGKYPGRTQDGYSNRIITLLDGEVVRSSINPYIDGDIPWKEIVVNPMSSRFYGLSPAEVIRFLQDSTDNMLMVYNDTADLAVRGPLMVGGTFGGDTERLAARNPNDVIQVQDVKQVAPVPFDISALGFAAQELMRRKLAMREASGAANPLQAIGSGDRTTATEFSELVRLASQRVEMMVQLIEHNAYPWIGRTLHSRLRQFAPPGGFLAFFRGESIEASLEDIGFQADVRFQGSRQAMSKFQQAAQYRELFNILGTFPQLAIQYPEPLTRYMRDIMEIPDAEAIVKRAAMQAQQQMYLQMLLEGGGDPSAAAGAAPVDEADFGTQAGETEREGQRLA